LQILSIPLEFSGTEMSLLWEKIVRPVMFGLDAERAHELAFGR
jgi:hypothetical protein